MQKHLDKALNRCYFYLKHRPRTEKEIYYYLLKNTKKYKINEKDIRDIIKELKHKSYIDDVKFVEWYVSKRLSSKPKAVFIIKSELKKFGVKDDLISVYFDENKIDEYEIAKKALIRVDRRFLNLDTDKKKEKQRSYLLSRGFKYDIINKVVEELSKKD
jgi:SOS response regulatory protein OraA/RecX